MKQTPFKFLALLLKITLLSLLTFSFAFQVQLGFAQEEKEDQGIEVYDENSFNPDTWADLKAPSMTKNIYLKAEDGAVFVTVWGWHCSAKDQPIGAEDEINKIFSLMPNYTGIVNTSMEYRSSSEAEKKRQILARELKWLHKQIEDYRSSPLEKSFQNVSFEKNGTIQTPYLNVLPGTSNIHVIRNHCYSKKELKAIKAQVLKKMQRIIDQKEAENANGSTSKIKDDIIFEPNDGHQLKVVLTREKSEDE